MNKPWLIAFVAVCAIGGAFYGGRMSVNDGIGDASNENLIEARFRTRTRSASPRHHSAYTKRSSILRKSVIIQDPSTASASREWVILPMDYFKILTRYEYQLTIGTSQSKNIKFDYHLLGMFGVPEEEKAILNQAAAEFGKKVHQTRSQHATYVGGEDDNDAYVEFSDFEGLIKPAEEKLRTSIESVLGIKKAKLLMDVAGIHSISSEPQSRFSKGRYHLSREVTMVSKNGEEPKKSILFWVGSQRWNESEQKWWDYSRSGSSIPDAGDLDLFSRAGLYPWPEQGIMEKPIE